MCLSRCSIAVRRHHGQGSSYKRTHLTNGLAYSFRGPVHYGHGKEHGAVYETFMSRSVGREGGRGRGRGREEREGEGKGEGDRH